MTRARYRDGAQGANLKYCVAMARICSAANRPKPRCATSEDFFSVVLVPPPLNMRFAPTGFGGEGKAPITVGASSRRALANPPSLASRMQKLKIGGRTTSVLFREFVEEKRRNRPHASLQTLAIVPLWLRYCAYPGAGCATFFHRIHGTEYSLKFSPTLPLTPML